MSGKDKALQGEGNYDAARRYRKDVEGFVAHEDIERAAKAAKPGNKQEARELAKAEEKGRSRAKG